MWISEKDSWKTNASKASIILKKGVTCQYCQNVWISEGKGNKSTGCDTYPYVFDEARMNKHEASYLVSIRLIFEFTLTSSVPCGEVTLQSNTDMQT